MSIESEVVQSQPFQQDSQKTSARASNDSSSSSTITASATAALRSQAPIDLSKLTQAQPPRDAAKEFSKRMKRDSRFKKFSTDEQEMESQKRNDVQKKGTKKGKKAENSDDTGVQNGQEKFSLIDPESLKTAVESPSKKPRPATSPARSRSPLLVLRSTGNSPIRLRSLDAVKPRVLPNPSPKSVNTTILGASRKAQVAGPNNDENSPVGKLKIDDPNQEPRDQSSHPYMKRLRSYRAL
jgi:hypothetical protein